MTLALCVLCFFVGFVAGVAAVVIPLSYLD